MLTSNKVDNKVKILFYDFISFENPRYLTKEIIKQARNEKGEARHQLLVVLQSIYQKSLEENEKASLKEITDYFKELKLQNLDKNDGGIVYRGLAILAPTEFNTKEAKLTSMDKIHVDIFSLKNDRHNEIKYINNIIYHLDHPDDNLVVTASYKYLTELLVSGDLNLFSSEGKHLFREYLSNKSMIEHDQSILYTSAFIEFKAALNANKPQEIPKLSYEYMQLLPPDIQATTFNGFSDLTKKEIKKLKVTGF